MVPRLRKIGAWLWHNILRPVWHYGVWRAAWKRILGPPYRVALRFLAKSRIVPWGQPVRWLLRSRNVLNLLAIGALVVSIGAAATVIGIAEVQIRSGRGGSPDIWNNSWFVVGLSVGSIGLMCLIVALSSNGSQSKARHEFPDLLFAIEHLVERPGEYPDITAASAAGTSGCPESRGNPTPRCAPSARARTGTDRGRHPRRRRLSQRSSPWAWRGQPGRPELAPLPATSPRQ